MLRRSLTHALSLVVAPPPPSLLPLARPAAVGVKVVDKLQLQLLNCLSSERCLTGTTQSSSLTVSAPAPIPVQQ